MKKFVFAISLSLIVTFLGDSIAQAAEKTDKKSSASELLELANKAHKEKNYDQAFRLWRQIQMDYKGTNAWPKAVYNTGIGLKEQKRFDEAIEVFKELLASDVNDTEPGAHIMEAYRNYRPKAQWEIGNCLLAKGDYEKALKAYHAAQHKHPFQSWCGTCRGSFNNRYALYQGLCYEHQGQYDNAIKSYFKTVMEPLSSNPTTHIRIVDLYQSQNQIKTLEKILDQIDKHLTDKCIKEHGRKLLDDPDFDEHMFTKTIRRILEIRKMGQQQKISELVELVVKASPEVYVDKYRDRCQHFQAIEAAKTLSKHPKKAVPLLKAKMMGDNRDKLIYYVLALCKNDEAVKILQGSTKIAHNCWQRMALEYSLDILEQGPLLSEADEGIYFPALPANVTLPQKLAQIDDDVAYWQSLPQKVSVDLSKPELTIKTFITSMIIADKNAHSKCFADSNLAEKMNEDDCRSLRTVYEITGVKFSNDNTAEVDLNLSIGHKSHRIMFILKNINNQWLITCFKEGRRLKTGK